MEEFAPVAAWLLEAAPWAVTAIGLSAAYYFFTKNRNAQAVDMADRAFQRMKDIEGRLDIVSENLRQCEVMNRVKDEEIAYLQRVVTWTTDYVNQLHAFWRSQGQPPPRPRYPPPPEPPSIKNTLDRTHH